MLFQEQSSLKTLMQFCMPVVLSKDPVSLLAEDLHGY